MESCLKKSRHHIKKLYYILLPVLLIVSTLKIKQIKISRPRLLICIKYYYQFLLPLLLVINYTFLAVTQKQNYLTSELDVIQQLSFATMKLLKQRFQITGKNTGISQS